MRRDLRLNCNSCGGFNEYHQKSGDPKSVVRCDGCGKKHSTDSVHFVELGKSYERDERGVLLEEPI